VGRREELAKKGGATLTEFWTAFKKEIVPGGRRK